MASSRVLLLYAHPSPHRSEINQPLFQDAAAVIDVSRVDLYREYPRFNIDIDVEQQRLLEHDVVIFQFPLYWYSTPALLKEWQDLVLEYNFAYGVQGTALKDKRFLCALTAGAPEHAYQSGGINHYDLNELLRPLQQMANLTGMHWLPPFVLYGARTAAQSARLSEHRHQWRILLEGLVANRWSLAQLTQPPTINELLAERGALA
ncbi:NAD(P)H-dependent oxidoreductase [Shewanella sp. GXUN23E]|uniref:NAD(P)H-dependent oxidoreductase n=1 Tax=Shewanella sp. GXUN23E TaxID=3422498 RepID=UPI003D7E67E2